MSSDSLKAPIQNNPLIPDLIINISTTPEKTLRYQLPTEAHNLPLIFISIHELAKNFRRAPENTGTRKGNTTQKRDAAEPVVRGFITEGSELNIALRKKCEQIGTPYDLSRIHVITDDQTMTLSPPVWSFMKRLIKNDIGRELVRSAEKDGKSGPGAEIGPILQATKLRRFYEYHRKAIAQKLKAEGQDKPTLEDRLVVQFATLTFTTLARPHHVRPLEARERQYLYLPHQDLSLPVRPWLMKDGAALEKDSMSAARSPNAKRKRSIKTKPYLERIHIASTFDYLTTEGNTKQPIAAHLPDYLRSMRSLHGRIINQILKATGHEPVPETLFDPVSLRLVEKGAAREITHKYKHTPIVLTPKNDNRFRVLQPFNVDNEKYIEIPGYIVERRKLSSFRLEDRHKLYEGADAYVFPPFDENNKELRSEIYKRIIDLLVDKTTNPRRSNAPIIIMDNGCYHDLLKLLVHCHEMGMAKNFMAGSYDGINIVTNGIRHTATNLFDVVQTVTKTHSYDEKLAHAAGEVLRFRQSRYRRPTFTDDPDFAPIVDGAAPDEKAFSIALLTSASNDNRRLLKLNMCIAHDATRKGWPVYYGLGDQHGMGAILKGVVSGGGQAVGAVTANLLYSETLHAALPFDLSHSVVFQHIYPRAGFLVNNATVPVATPGGYGTFQEEFMTDPSKPRVLAEGDIHAEGKFFWEPHVRAFYPASAWKDLLRHGRHENLHLAFGQSGVFKKLVTLRAEYLEQQGEEARDIIAREKLRIAQHSAKRTRNRALTDSQPI